MASRFHNIEFELVRPGPPHNQLLSRLTPYMALCGEGSPVTMHIDLEHRQLLDRLERTRYVTLEGPAGGGHGKLTAREVPDRLRESSVESLGEDVATVLRQAPSLLAELARIRGREECEDETSFVHLRLRLGGSELALLPFEMALSPQAHPGEGMEFFLQSTLPIVPTREIRSSRPIPINWNQPRMKVLIVSASPGTEIPELDHVRALRRAIEPWVAWPDPEPGEDDRGRERRRLPLVRRRLRILRNASIDDIRDACAREKFTHIHILAHGDHREDAGEARHGIALCDPNDKARKQVVSGHKLAKALLAESDDGNRCCQPVVVTLATCDSGNGGSVLVRGGSIAHDLHSEGIPWVFASQFPLTWRGSVRFVEELYPRILRGDDPRRALFEARRQIYMSAERDHDWASLVAYSSVPSDFDAQVSEFFESQTRWAINVGLGGYTSLTDTSETTDGLTREILQRVEDRLELWRGRLPTKRKDLPTAAREQRAECFGIHGSAYKRLGLLFAARGKTLEKGSAKYQESCAESAANLEKAHEYYLKGRTEWATGSTKHHWVTAQYLSLAAVLDKGRDEPSYEEARWLSEIALRNAGDDDKAWAHATMAELSILGLYHSPKSVTKEEAARDVRNHCRAIVRLVGRDSFHVSSTRRQFERYRDHWPSARWNDAVEVAVHELRASSTRR